MKLPYKTTEHNFYCSEMTVKQYKEFLKSIYGEEVILKDFVEHFLETFSVLSNKPIEFFYGLNFYDLFVLLIQLRFYTLGEECPIVLTQENKEEEEKPNKRTIYLNLKRMVDEILFSLETTFPQFVNNENIVLQIRPPSFKRMQESYLEESWSQYISDCTIKDSNTQQTLKLENSLVAKRVIEKLPTKLSSQLMFQSKEAINTISSINFLEPYEGCENTQLTFQPSLENLLWFCKLFFGEDLDTFYSNLFYLSKIGGMDLNYIETCTPGELIFFINKVQEILKKQETNENSEPPPPMIGGEDAINGM